MHTKMFLNHSENVGYSLNYVVQKFRPCRLSVQPAVHQSLCRVLSQWLQAFFGECWHQVWSWMWRSHVEVGFCSELEFSETQCQDPQLSMVLRSFTSIRCSYQHFDNDSDHFLHSLRSFTVFIVFTFKKCLIKQTFACHPSNSFASFLKTTF